MLVEFILVDGTINCMLLFYVTYVLLLNVGLTLFSHTIVLLMVVMTGQSSMQ